MSTSTKSPVDNVVLAGDDPEVPHQDDRYSVFTKAEKWCIIAMISWASFSSNLSGFIYFPLLDLLAKTFSVSVARINLTITAYVAVATVAPTLAGDAADMLGRRPVYIATLGLYTTANICLGVASTYGELVGFRVLQAVGAAGIGIVAYGVVSDIATPAERGLFVSALSFTVTIAPSLGPVLGGALNSAAGWAWVFRFLTIISSLGLLVIILFLPETSRNIVGNGSVRPVPFLRPPIPWFVRHHWKQEDHHDKLSRRSCHFPNPMRSLIILFRKDNAVVVMAYGLMYAVYTCDIGTLSTTYIDIYGLSSLQAGLIYLPFGLGGTVSALFSGYMLDLAYRRARAKRGLSTDKVKGDDLNNFPVEKPRIGVMWPPMIVTMVCVIGHGWALQCRQHIALPLVLQFIIGLALQFNFSAFNTLVVDINHQSPAAASASTGIIRCAMGAIAITFLEDMIQAVGIGWTFTFVGGLCVVALALFAVEYHKGLPWRQQAMSATAP